MKLPRPSLEVIIFVGVGLVISAVALRMLSASELYQAVARTKVAPPSHAGPWFLQAEFEVIRSESVLGKVIEKLGLPAQWGRNKPSRLTASEALEMLKRRMELRVAPGTESLIEIRVRSEDAAEAARIANTVAEMYREVRREQNQRVTSEAEKLGPKPSSEG